jgi:hypothetical protein
VVLRSLVVSDHDLLGMKFEVVHIRLLCNIVRSICFHDHHCLPSSVGTCLIQIKVDTECRGARGGYLTDAFGVLPYDSIRSREVSLSTCRTDCSVTKNGEPLPTSRYKSASVSDLAIVHSSRIIADVKSVFQDLI